MKYFVYLMGLLSLLFVMGCEDEHEHHEHHGGAYDGTYNGYGHGEYRAYPDQYYNGQYYHHD